MPSVATAPATTVLSSLQPAIPAPKIWTITVATN
jgi:hypothetical protein